MNKKIILVSVPIRGLFILTKMVLEINALDYLKLFRPH